MRRLNVLLVLSLAALLALTGTPLTARAAGAQPQPVGELTDREPNSSCAEAQDLGALSGALRLPGSIEPGSDGIDFFRLTAAPGMRLALELRGASSGQGTLADPLIGVFDAACNLITSMDDSYAGLEPVLILHVPADGVIVIAATAFGDFNFVGAGYSGGSYTLRVDEARLIAGITGRLIDNTTGAAPNGWLQLILQRCEAETCTTLRSGEEIEGAFTFPSSESEPLFAGSYQLVVRSERYAPLTIGPFAVMIDELKTLESVTLSRLPEIGSISGRLVNAIGGAPLGANVAAAITLNRCVEGDCQYYITSLSPDPEGYFRFDAASLGQPLMVGEYLVVGNADQFANSSLGAFTVTEGQQYQLGDLALQPNPIQFYDAQGCAPISPQGGACAYSIRLLNNQPERAELQVWSIIQIGGPSSGTFQPEPAQPLSLDSGESRVLGFSVNVPPEVPEYTSICATIFVADAGEGYYFRPRASSFVFCSEVVAPQP